MHVIMKHKFGHLIIGGQEKLELAECIQGSEKCVSGAVTDHDH